MKSNRMLLGVAVSLLLVLVGGAAEPIVVGLSRADLIQQHGKPVSTAGKGAREFLTYPEGRVVLENGVVTKFEPAATGSAGPVAATGTAVPAASSARPDPLQPRADPRAVKAGWLSSLDAAVAKATAENKPILFLLSGNMDQCPWGRQFNDTVEYSNHFVRKIQADYVPLRINISEMGGSFEAESKEEVDRMAEKFEAFAKMRQQVFSSLMIPGLAVLSSDGKQSTEVDMTGALEAVMRGHLDEYTLTRVAVARDGPRKEVKSLQASASKTKFIYLVGGLVVLVVLIKKFTS